MDEFNARGPVTEGVATTQRPEMPPCAELGGISLESAATGCAGHCGQLAAADGHQAVKRVWLLKHVDPPGADRRT